MEIFLLFFIFALVLFLLIGDTAEEKEYKNSTYHKAVKETYSKIKNDKGKYGEYLIYQNLKNIENSGGRFLFNLYIPKKSGNVTEIDILLICQKGFIVFESKNYSGWIFGNESHKYWTQVLPKGWYGDSNKEKFYNPIQQNKNHIKHLANLLEKNIPIQSVIIFSNECTLKDVTVNQSNVHITYCKDALDVMRDIYRKNPKDSLTQQQIEYWYKQLIHYTQPDKETVLRHEKEIIKFKKP